ICDFAAADVQGKFAECRAPTAQDDTRGALAGAGRAQGTHHAEHRCGVLSGGFEDQRRIAAPRRRSHVPGEKYQPGQRSRGEHGYPPGYSGQRGIGWITRLRFLPLYSLPEVCLTECMLRSEAARYARWSAMVALALAAMTLLAYVRRDWVRHFSKKSDPPAAPAGFSPRSPRINFTHHRTHPTT